MRQRWSPVLVLIAALALVALAMRGCGEGVGDTPIAEDRPVTETAPEPARESRTRVIVGPGVRDDANDGAAGELRCTLRATVIDIDGVAVADALVVVTTSDGRERQARSDAEGRVVLADLPPGETTLGLEIDGWRETWPDSDAWAWLPSDLEMVLQAVPLAHVTGRVVDADGRPLAGALVGIGVYGLGGASLDYVTRAGADGAYRLAYAPDDISAKSFIAAWMAGHEPGTDTLSDVVAGPDLRRDFLLRPPNGEIEREALTADFAAFEETDEDLTDDAPAPLPETRTVRARVVDTDGRPIAGAWISTGSRGQVARSAADGTFAAPVAEHDSLHVAAAGHLALDRSLGWEDGPPGDLVLARRHDVSARFVFADDGSPVVGALVNFDESAAVTGPDGVALFRDVSPVLFEGPNVWCYVRPARRDLPQPVEGPIEGLTEEDLAEIRLERGATLSARVLGPDGAPHFGAWAWVDSHELDSGGCRTDLDGRFTLTGLPNDPALRVAVYDESVEHAELHVTLAESLRDPELEIRFPATDRITGTLTLPEGVAQHETLTIEAVPEEPFPPHVEPLWRETEIAADGSFAFEGAEGVDYRLRLEANPDFAQRLTGDVVVRSGTEGFRVTALPGVAITGRIVDGYGALPNAKVRVIGTARGSGRRTVSSGEGGRFRIDGVEDGLVYRVHYKKSEHDPSWHALPDLVGGATDVVLEVP